MQGGECRGGSPGLHTPRLVLMLLFQMGRARRWKIGETAFTTLRAPGAAPLSNSPSSLRRIAQISLQFRPCPRILLNWLVAPCPARKPQVQALLL